MSDAQIEALSDRQNSAVIGAADRPALACTEAMTRDIHVPDADFAAVRKLFDDRHRRKLAAAVSAYNLVSRFLIAVQVGHEPQWHYFKREP